MPDYLAVDTDTLVVQAVAEGWRRAQVQAVGRYLRNCTDCEVHTIHQAGLKIWSIYETTPTYDSYFTEAQGRADAEKAIAQAQALMVPSGKPIFFAVDYTPDAPHAPAIIKYFQAIMDTFRESGNPYAVGVYGNYAVCWWLWNTEGLNNLLHYWQTTGNGSCGYVYPYADALQIPTTCGNEATLCGCSVDFDIILDPNILW